MATPGPKPKPIEQAIRDGTKPNRIPNPPLRTGLDPVLTEPEGFTTYQSVAWRELVKELTDLDILDAADAATVETAAAMVGRMREARHALNRSDMIEYTQRGAAVPSPWWKIEREAALQAQRLLSELGLSPTARARLANTGVKSAKPDETLDAMLGPSARLKVVEGGKQ